MEMKSETKHLQRNATKWDSWANSMDGDGRRYSFLRESQGKVISLLNVREGIHFLDVGCGTGWAVGQVAKLVNDKGLFYGVDLSPRMIEKAKSNFSGRGNLYFIQANVESIPLDDDFFDILICTNSFHHYPNPKRALEEMHRLLKEGGKIYILDPVADTWVVRLADRFIRLAEPEHVKIYSTHEYQQLFREAGLKYNASEIINWHQGIHIGEK